MHAYCHQRVETALTTPFATASIWNMMPARNSGMVDVVGMTTISLVERLVLSTAKLVDHHCADY